ncbi:amidohydrolase family protein [bacterium]|nr:amidohydrolase family protein [bacterium]
MIIDFHTHIWRYPDGSFARGRRQSSAEQLIESMDRAGVARAGIVPLAYVQAPPPRPLMLDNDYMLESVRRYPDRLFGFVEVNPYHEDAAATVAQFLTEGLTGLKLVPNLHGYQMSDHALLDPLLAICADAHAPVFVRANDDITSTPLQIEEMARTFPEIPAFVIGQMGRKWLFREALMVAKRTDNVYLETSDTNEDDIFDAVTGSGAPKVLYASHWFPDEMTVHLSRHRAAIADPGDLVRVLGLNAQKILDARSGKQP